jgi:hypothetical protein
MYGYFARVTLNTPNTTRHSARGHDLTIAATRQLGERGRRSARAISSRSTQHDHWTTLSEYVNPPPFT